MAHPLDGAWLKAARAREHLAALRAELPGIAVRPYRVVGGWEGDRYVIRYSVIDDGSRVPRRIGMMAADVIHNLRTSLDHVAWQLAGLGAGQHRGTTFPIFEDAADYADREPRALRGVPAEGRSTIERLQPYHIRAVQNGTEAPRDLSLNALLMVLGRLDNVDKHTVLLATHSVAQYDPPAVKNVASGQLHSAGGWVTVEDGALLCYLTDLVPADPTRPIELEADPQVTLIFGRPIPLTDPNVWADRHAGGMSVADLHAAADDTERLIGLFVNSFRAD